MNITFNAMMAMVYFDLGQVSPWSFIVNSSVAQSLDSTTQLYEALTGTGGFANQTIDMASDAKALDININELAAMQVQYTCRFQQPKSPAQIFVATAVATLTLSTNAWSAAMLILAWFAKRGDKP